MMSIESLQKQIKDLEKQKQLLLEEKKLILQQTLPINEKINSTMSLARSLKAERDEFNSLVKKNKESRKAVGGEIRNLIVNMREISGQRKDYFGLDDTKTISQTLNSLEWKLQTEARTPKQEESLSKYINKLSLFLKGAKERDKLSKEGRNVRVKLESLKKEFDAYHMLVLNYAKESESKHQKLKEISEKISGLKDERSEFDDKLDELSKQAGEIITELKDKRSKLEELENKLEEERQKKDKAILKKKLAAVKRKLKKREKLTTDDLIVLQEAG